MATRDPLEDTGTFKVSSRKLGATIGYAALAAVAGAGGGLGLTHVTPDTLQHMSARLETMDRHGTQVGQQTAHALAILEATVERIDREGSRVLIGRIEECRGRITSLESFRVEIGERLRRIEDTAQQILLRLTGRSN